MELPIFVFNEQVITDGAMTGDISSSAKEVSEIKSVAGQIYWAGTSPVGTFVIQGSNDGTNWANLMSPVAVSGNSGGLIIQNEPSVRYIRLHYIFTSGTGTLQGLLSAKR